MSSMTAERMAGGRQGVRRSEGTAGNLAPLVCHAGALYMSEHGHPLEPGGDHLLLFVNEGQITIERTGNTCVIGKGAFGFLEPHPHTRLTLSSGTTGIFARFELAAVSRLPIAHTGAGDQPNITCPSLSALSGCELPIRLELRRPTHFRSILIRLVGAWQRQSPFAQFEANLCASELILVLLEDYAQDSAKRLAAPNMEAVAAFISSHLAEPLTVQELAGRANLSSQRFTTEFRRMFGESPYRYLLHLRIERAQQLLATTDLPQRAVAEACGFSDVHHFNKTFNRITRASPGAYRKQAVRQ